VSCACAETLIVCVNVQKISKENVFKFCDLKLENYRMNDMSWLS
jgi:hypothetical protein